MKAITLRIRVMAFFAVAFVLALINPRKALQTVADVLGGIE